MTSKSKSESFFMSIMSAQDPGFNGGIWVELESYVRTWAYDNESIYVVTGPVLTKDSYPTIGINKVAVPEYYYKVILDYTGDEIKAIGFILPNKKSVNSIQDFAVTVDEVEMVTKIDFFPLLEDDIEQVLESHLNTSLWSFKQFNSTDKSITKPDLELKKQIQSPGTFWINSSSMTRHNSSCRYYNNTKYGYFSNEQIGEACKTCGG